MELLFSHPVRLKCFNPGQRTVLANIPTPSLPLLRGGREGGDHLFWLMKCLFSFLLIFIALPSCSHENYHIIKRMYIYNIQQHNDSIYFSTLESGIFRFSPDCPDSFLRVGGHYRHPVRSIAFSKTGACFAASYQVPLHSRDSLRPFLLLPQPAWSIKIDAEGTPWLAGIRCVFKQRNDSLIPFNRAGEAHDIAFVGKEIAVAHKNGISIFNKETGALIREFCKGVLFWTITNYDSLFIGGGLNRCVIIDKDKCKTITFGPKSNMVWSVALDSAGTLYLATQKGLYRAKKGRDKAQCIGFRGTCIKSLLIDNKDRLWVGRFSKDER
jgi:hypothetical protein